MDERQRTAAALVAVLLAAAPAAAQTGPYGAIGVGAGTLTGGGSQTGGRASLGAGLVFDRNRFELEAVGGLGGGDTDELASLGAVLVNYAREFEVAPTTRFYLGAGVGGGAFDSDLFDGASGSNRSESAVVGQLATGFILDVPGPVAFDIGARVQSYNSFGDSQGDSSVESIDGLVRLIIGR